MAKAPPKKRAPAKAVHKAAPAPKKKPLTAAQELYPKEKLPYGKLPPSALKSAGWLTGGHTVRIQAWAFRLEVTALLGPDGGIITAGFGDWQAVSIPRGDPFTQWQGRTLFEMTLDLMLDGWSAHRSVEADIAKLERLATRIPGTLAPTQVRIWGPIPKPGLAWVITGIDYGDVIRDPRTGQRWRQAMTLKLMEYREETQVAQLPRAAATKKPPQKYKVKKGDTLKTIAAKYLGSSGKWQQIVKANKGLRGFNIPKSFIGKTIQIPPK